MNDRARIFYFKNPPPPQPVLFFHRIDNEIIKFVSTGNPATRLFKSIVVAVVMAIWFVSIPYIVIDVLVRVFGNAIHGRSRINSLILEKLNEMYIKSLIPDFSPSFSKVAYKPCQIGFSGEEQKKQSVILPNQPKIQWGLELSGFS